MRLIPKSLAGQMIALLLIALIGVQVIGFFILFDQRRHAARVADREQVLQRTASVVRLLAETPNTLNERVIAAASGPRLAFWLAEESAVAPAEAVEGPLRERLARLLAGTDVGLVRLRIERGVDQRLASWWRRDERRYHRLGRDDDDDDGDDDDDDGDDDHDDDHDHDHDWRKGEGDRDHRYWQRRRRLPLSLTLSIALPDGRWLNAQTLLRPAAAGWAWPPIIILGTTALAIIVIVIYTARRITRPMRALAGAAESFGRGESVAPLPLQGPEDVRRTTAAFNQMRDRLARFVADRMGMLAAISHDLRTPITTLRLRAEFVEDEALRDKLLETLDEMQEMTEAVLAFVREDAAREDTRRVDLAALVGSLVDDLSDLGREASVEEIAQTPYHCRPSALRRALRNLIDNALAYGTRARVSLKREQGFLDIVVDDDGPGIAAEDLEKVFEPFFRLEASRSRETGGVGLGLAIARTIARNHGGDILLENRPEGGLRAIFRLPEPKPI